MLVHLLRSGNGKEKPQKRNFSGLIFSTAALGFRGETKSSHVSFCWEDQDHEGLIKDPVSLSTTCLACSLAILLLRDISIYYSKVLPKGTCLRSDTHHRTCDEIDLETRTWVAEFKQRINGSRGCGLPSTFVLKRLFFPIRSCTRVSWFFYRCFGSSVPFVCVGERVLDKMDRAMVDFPIRSRCARSPCSRQWLLQYVEGREKRLILSKTKRIKV